MRFLKIIAVGLVGLILGFVWSLSLSSGYFQEWVKLPDPSSPIAEFVTVEDGSVIAKTTDSLLLRCSSWRDECWVLHDEAVNYAMYSTVVKQPCDFSAPEFSWLKSHPKNITACIQGVTQYPEGVGKQAYVTDADGSVWEWNHIFTKNHPLYLYAVTAPAFCSFFGLIISTVRLFKHFQRPEIFSARGESQRPAHKPSNANR